jgi:hypothetical protein
MQRYRNRWRACSEDVKCQFQAEGEGHKAGYGWQMVWWCRDSSANHKSEADLIHDQ